MASVHLYTVINAGIVKDGCIMYVTLERNHEDPYPEVAHLGQLAIKLRAIRKRDEFLHREKNMSTGLSIE